MDRDQRRQWRNYVIGCTDLTPAHKVVLLGLELFADYPAGTNARPGIEALAHRCDLKERVVRLALERGRQLGLIEQTERANPKRGFAAVYRLLRAPDSTGTSVPLEPHEPTFLPARNDVSTGTKRRFNRHERAAHQDINTKTEHQVTTREGTCVKGTYLPESWSPPPDVVVQMRSEQPHVDQDMELRKFCDYWHSTTRNATKGDWTATYRNWIRRAGAGVNGQRPAAPRSTADERVRQTQALKGKFASSNQLELG